MTKPPLQIIRQWWFSYKFINQKKLNLNNNEIEISLHLRHKKLRPHE